VSSLTASDIVKQQWDVIVVGTGVGGATLGYALAKAGKRVLFCEKGASHLAAPDALSGRYAETFFEPPSAPQTRYRDILIRSGRYSDPIQDTSMQRPLQFIPYVGSGTGGSSALYGMALERFFPSDFLPRGNHPNASDTTLPDEWPVLYEALVPFYESAEKLYRVRGTADPLRGEPAPEHFRPPPALTPGSQEIYDFLKGKGLHPYRLPLACEHVAGCECCQGYLCAKNCKNDSARICLEPAILQHKAGLLDRCEVTRLEASSGEVTGLVCSWHGSEIRLRAPIVVLAAGALETPALLLNSSSDRWPNGLANDSGMVGRNLMRHHIDLYLVTPKTKGPLDNRQKELAFNDFYRSGDKTLGSVQSFGRLPTAPMLVESLEQDIRDGPAPWAAPFFKLIKPMLKMSLEKLVERSFVLATIMEDLPYRDNIVAPVKSAGSGSRLTLKYKVHPQDLARTAAFRTAMLELLRPYKTRLIKQAENNQRIAHVCGTCRFGNDPKTSVLDANNRAFGVSNLYVVDSSFFPSSAGTNPSLTIAANALRVAQHLIEQAS
jgi:choline dehydrogenase-like flavoprotein